MAKKTKNDIIKDLLQELNAVKSFYGRTDVSEAEKQAHLSKLSHLQRQYARTIKGSKNIEKN